MRISDWSSDVCSSDLAKPAYLRVKVWRRLQAIGAAPLKNAVHALPNREATRALFEELHREIADNGGEGLILEARRSEERSVGKECVSTCRSRGTAYH